MSHPFLFAFGEIFGNMLLIIGFSVAALLFLTLVLILKSYHKVPQGKAIVRTGMGGTKVSFDGIFVYPVIHQREVMDISLKSIEIARLGNQGLICKDNMRADIKVVFFVRVNKTALDVMTVAQTIGCDRASHQETLVNLFDAKFSEALKTVGKQFDFVDLYNSRERFKKQILETIGSDLNGYHLDDCAIDYLEQTPLSFLKDDNILDSEGIKKIADLTARQHIEANKIRREEEQVITKQNVEAQEAILALNRQLAEKQEIQHREIAAVKAREQAETIRIQSEEKKRSERARIEAEQEIQVAEENKQRNVIVAEKARERTMKVEAERVERDKQLEMNERERVVTLAQIEKEKALEAEKKNIQDVIRERVSVEKAVVEEQEKILNTKAFMEADREKQVAITRAQKEAEESGIKLIQTADANRAAAELDAKKKLVDAEAELRSAELQAEARKKIAEARVQEEAAKGLGEAKVQEARALAREKEGEVEARVMEKQAIAEAKGLEVRAQAQEVEGIKLAHVMEQKAMAEAKGREALAEALQKSGLAEAKVLEEKALAEARGIQEKAEAMKKLDGVGREHEEFKLRLAQQTELEKARIAIQEKIAQAQASVMAEALKSANIDIVGGETMFFEKIMEAITRARAIDAHVEHSTVLSRLSDQLLNLEGGDPVEKVRNLVKRLGVTSEDVKNLSMAALLTKLASETGDSGQKGLLGNLLSVITQAGIGDQPASILGL